MKGLRYKGICDYSENFLNHNINGKRLLMMKKSGLRNIGILSEGHLIDFFVRKNFLYFYFKNIY
jgi:hypothetical protein